VMELVRGVTLRAELDRVTTLPPGEAADWFDGVLEGLAAAHAHGIVHRDLKPENVIGQRGTTRQIAPKILDFGLAKVSATEALVPGTMTAEGIVLGTLGYMSPEQLLGAPVDERADLFAIGVMIAEALTGTRPFRGDTFADLSRSVLHADCQLALPFPESGGLDRLLRRCLCKEPSQRIASAGELRSELVPLLRALAT
jgi:serine/threonine protein kinase